MQPDPTFARIMETYGRAWETRDADLVLTIFTEDATYHENPFHEPIRGHDSIRRHWEGATGAHRDVAFRWQLVTAVGELRVIEWQAEFTRNPPGHRMELRGMMFLELRGERIARLREYWHRKDA